jgi:uncharacterized protein
VLVRRVLVAVALALPALTGCSAGSTPAAGPTPESSTTAPPATTQPATTPSSSPTRDRSRDAPLIRAARRGDADRVRRLLARGAGVRARDPHRATALVAASYGNHVAVARLLVDAGADVNAQDDTRQSAFLIATSEVGDDPRLLDLTLAHGADVRRLDSFRGTGLIRAAERGHVRVIRRLLRTSVDVDHVNRLGWTALHEAVILGDGSARYVRVVQLLVAGGADVNLPSRRDGVRPLSHATRRGHAQVAQVLRRAGARA